MILALQNDVLKEVAYALGTDGFNSLFIVSIDINAKTLPCIQHTSPVAVGLCINISLLQQQLKACVEQEEYEKAAELRDRIRAMKQELAAKGGGRENA